VQSLCPLCPCGEPSPSLIDHKDTKDTEIAQRSN
jgi:hypothetical protein